MSSYYYCFIIRLHRSTTEMWPIATDAVGWHLDQLNRSRCRFGCGMWTLVGPRNHVLDGRAHWRHLANTTHHPLINGELGWRHTFQRERQTFWTFVVMFWYCTVCPRFLLRRFIMAALCNRGAIIFLPCDFYLSFFLLLSFFSSPNLSGRRLDLYHTSTHGVALVRI